MEAECTGCRGRVMPYRQYIFHFGPRAVCSTCGHDVRLRHFGRVVVAGLAAVVGLMSFLVAVSASPVLFVAALALIVLSCLLADFWTYRNLPWDPVEAEPAGSD